MDKLLKVLWLVIGMLPLLILPISGYYFVKDKFFPEYPDDYLAQSLIVGTEQKGAITKGKFIHGIVYDRIERIIRSASNTLDAGKTLMVDTTHSTP